MSELTYSVLPQDPKPRFDKPVELPVEIDNRIQGTATAVALVVWLVLIGLIVAAYYALAVHSQDIPLLLIGGLSFVPAITVGAITYKRLLARAKRKQKKLNDRIEEERELARVAHNATQLTKELREIYASAATSGKQVREHLTNASGWLNAAETEFRANAFDPYWTAIEHAAAHLASVQQETKNIAGHAENYYKKLAEQKHTFPAFPVTINSLPSIERVTKEFQRIVRLGQTNFEFSNIWEHRRTREVLMAGFRTMGDVIHNLGSSITDSVHSLERSTSSGIAKLIEEEIRTRDQLDRITSSSTPARLRSSL